MAACSFMPGLQPGETIAQAPSSVKIRPPAVGQQWVYKVRNVYNGLVVDEVTETISSVDPVVRIARTSQSNGAMHDEIQSPWGHVVQDSHWDLPVTFTTPLPAWPPGLALGSSRTYDDQYQLIGDMDYSAHWSLTMTPMRWSTIAVPAGTFTVMRFDNVIDYTSDDLSVIASQRQESVWFAPEIGRWAMRRSRGTYTMSGRGSEFHEDYVQWELVSWR
jgi:hypothetical protein